GLGDIGEAVVDSPGRDPVVRRERKPRTAAIPAGRVDAAIGHGVREFLPVVVDHVERVNAHVAENAAERTRDAQVVADRGGRLAGDPEGVRGVAVKTSRTVVEMAAGAGGDAGAVMRAGYVSERAYRLRLVAVLDDVAVTAAVGG